MKKLMKKVSLLSMGMLFLLVNFNVKAYTQDIEPNRSIVFNEYLVNYEQNYITLKNELKDKNAVVNQQYIKLTQSEFNSIRDAVNKLNKYVTEANTTIDANNKALASLQEEVNALKQKAEAAGATEAMKEEYKLNLKKYNEKVDEANKYKTDADSKANSLNASLKALIPSYKDNNWKKLNLSMEESTGNKYAVDYINEEYVLSWVKVTLNGKDYYNYMVYCEKETKKVCKIENGKYYNKSGVEVTKEEYEKDCETKKVCKIENGKYYNKSGVEVSEEDYRIDCETKNICKIENDTYYNKDGNVVTKEEYEKSCLPDNPKTGLNVNYLYAVLIPLVALSSYVVVKKARKFSR